MADEKISAMPAMTALAGTEKLAGVQTAGINSVATPAQIGAYHNGQANTYTAQQTISRAGLPLDLVNSTNAASNQVLTLESDRATPANNDEAYISFKLSNSAGTQTEMARITGQASSVTAGNESGRLYFWVANSPTLTSVMFLSGGALRPTANDGVQLGSGTLSFADLFLASGGVINWNNGNATLTHSAGQLASNVPLILPTYTVATLPTPVTGMRARVSDANATTFYSTVAGGGSNVVPVFYNGTNWVIA